MQGVIDYAELVHRAVLLASRPEVAEQLAGRYDVVFVDEYQDTDPAQVRLLEALAGQGRSLVAFGDPDQSIYAFRGADVNGILDFPDAFPGRDGRPARVEVLTTSRRSGAKLLQATRLLTRRMPLPRLPAEKTRAHRELAAVREGGHVETYTYPTASTELENIADILRRAHLEDGVPWSDMAVLVRAGGRTIPSIRRALTSAGVPLDVDGDDVPLRHEPAVSPLLTALRAVAQAATHPPAPSLLTTLPAPGTAASAPGMVAPSEAEASAPHGGRRGGPAEPGGVRPAAGADSAAAASLEGAADEAADLGRVRPVAGADGAVAAEGSASLEDARDGAAERTRTRAALRSDPAAATEAPAALEGAGDGVVGPGPVPSVDGTDFVPASGVPGVAPSGDGVLVDAPAGTGTVRTDASGGPEVSGARDGLGRAEGEGPDGHGGGLGRAGAEGPEGPGDGLGHAGGDGRDGRGGGLESADGEGPGGPGGGEAAGGGVPRPGDGDAGWLGVETALALLASPLGGMDTADLRRLGRALRDEERAAGNRLPPSSDTLLALALAQPERLVAHDPAYARGAQRLGALLRKARELLEGGGTAEEALWELWDGTPWPGRLERAALRGGAAGRNADRDLDAVCALFDAAARAEERTGGRGALNFLEELDAQDIAADTLGRRAVRPDAVRLMTAHRSKGLEWRLVVVAGVQEGLWPDLRRRGSLLEADRIGRDGLAEPLSPGALLTEERRLFYVAATRARERLVVTAVKAPADDGDQPSRFLAELGVEPGTSPAAPAAPSPSPRSSPSCAPPPSTRTRPPPCATRPPAGSPGSPR